MYRRIAFVMKEKSPRVTMLRGSENKFKTGLSTIFRNESTNPEKRRVWKPPCILTPVTTWERIKREIALNTVFLTIPFTLKG